MQRLLEWTLETIRAEGSDFSWMEEYRFDWAPLAQSAVSRLLKGETMLVLTDEKRQWFDRYILGAVNDPEKARPFLPVYTLQSLFPNLEALHHSRELELLEDMLSISFPGGYFFWYVGGADHPYTKLVYRQEENFLWLIDGQAPGAFPLRAGDPLLDIRLLQLYKLFDRTLEAALFSEIDIDA